MSAAQHAPVKVEYLNGHTWKAVPGDADILASHDMQRGSDPGHTGELIVAGILAQMQGPSELGARWRGLLAGQSWRVSVYAGNLPDWPDLYWPSYPSLVDRRDIDLAELGRIRAGAKATLDDATAALRAGVLRALEEGRTEAEIARTAGVDRMTVRKWAGK